ncbi:MAG: ABC transporter ATP-binding protein [Acidobacteriaceae bacterium]|nr:ABC transporter ATP-binding protein [Acidobacteriaceae bacterium]
MGLGDLPLQENVPALAAAINHAGADDVIEDLAHGLETQLGPTWPDGVEISFGRRQKLALARGFMREPPLLLILGEPTAALTQRRSMRFLSVLAAAPADRRLAVSRFSCLTALVLSGWPISSCPRRRTRFEAGNHHELMAQAGQFAELYKIQAAAYR